MTHTDRQKYMAELNKLLTFMFKEDRAEIIQHYNELLDNAEDESALLEEFGSPTKLAVSISRSYNRDERKLAVTADSKEDAPEKPAAEAKAPEKPQAPEAPKAPQKPSEPEVYTGTYADIVEEFRRQRALEEGVEYKPIFFDESEPTPVEEPAPVEEPTPAEEPAPAEESAPTEELESVEESAPVEEPVPTEEPAPTEELESVEESAPVEEPAPAEEPAPTEEPAPAEEPNDGTFEEYGLSDAEEAAEERRTQRKTNVPLLILYLIIAIPLGIVGVALVIAIGAVVIAAAAAAAFCGVKLFVFAFSGLTVFADIFITAGAALVCCAVALLLLWFGVWGIASGVSGVIVGLKALGRKLCVKEVAVDE